MESNTPEIKTLGFDVHGKFHPAPPERCRNCRFWFREQITKTQEGDVAPCRRFPPTMVLGPVPRAMAGQMPVAPARLPDPATPAEHWCGEYKLAIFIKQKIQDGLLDSR